MPDLIELIAPEEKKLTPSDKPFYRVSNIAVGHSTQVLDVSRDQERQYGDPFSWIRTLSQVGWKLPSLQEYHAVFSGLYGARGNRQVRSQVAELRNSFQAGEFLGHRTPTATSTVISYCSCGEGTIIQDYGQPEMWSNKFPGFTSGRIGKHADHKDALKVLVGTGDIDVGEVAEVWEWIAGQEVNLIFEAKKCADDFYTVTLGGSYEQSGLGIVVANYNNVSIKARAFRKIHE